MPPALWAMLSLARLRSCSRLRPEYATPTTGTLSAPRLVIAYSAEKICLRAKFPVAPKRTSASEPPRPAPMALTSAALLLVSKQQKVPGFKISVLSHDNPFLGLLLRAWRG